MKKLFLYVLIFITMPIMAKASKKAEAIWLFLDPIENSTNSPNDSVFIKFSIDKAHLNTANEFFPEEHFWIVEIENNSERDIYIDLQKSFVLTAGEAEPMYTPKSVSNSESKTSGVGVNLGIISIGSANNSSSAETTLAQRIIIVPSDSYKKLMYPVFYENIYNFRETKGKITTRYIYDNIIEKYIYESRITEIADIHSKQVECYQNDNTIMRFGIRINYSYNEDLSNQITNKQMFYVKYMVGSRQRWASGQDIEEKIVLQTLPNQFYEYYNMGRIIRLWIW